MKPRGSSEVINIAEPNIHKNKKIRILVEEHSLSSLNVFHLLVTGEFQFYFRKGTLTKPLLF